MNTNQFLILILLCLLAIVWIRQWARDRIQAEAAPKLKTPRPLKPKTAEDCPFCRAEKEKREDPQPKQPLKPWLDVKSPRGRKKTLSTQGHSCPNPTCTYFGIIDESIHALVGYGRHGKTDRIQDLRCQACGRKISVRWGTALYRLKTSSTSVALILALMAEGVDVSALERVFGIREGTLRTWLTRAGLQAGKVHCHFFHHLVLHHLQLDELWTQVRQGSQVVWVWAVVEASSKLVPVLKLGPRSMDLAYSVVHDLCQILQPGCIPIFTSDGLKLYFYALTAHFGRWQFPEGARKPVWEISSSFLYAQLKKIHRRRRLVRVERHMLCRELEYLKDGLQALGLSGKINTAFIERLNLTLRQGVSFLTRRTWGMAQSTPELEVSLDWWRAYYHFVRYHESLRVKLSQPQARKGRQTPRRYRRRTPAMAAGFTPHRWTVFELLSFPLP
jgi:IS1 family transposase